MSEKKVASDTKATSNKKTTVGSAEAGREVLEAIQTPVSESSKLTDLLNKAAQLPKPEVPNTTEKPPSIKQEEAAGRELVKKLTPHFTALMAAEAELANAKKTSTNGNGNIFATEANRAKLEQMLQAQKSELEKKVEELKSMLQPFFDAAPGLRAMLETNFQLSQNTAMNEQATQAMIERVKELAAKNFEGGVTPGRVSVFLEKAARMIGVLTRVPAEETAGMDRNSKKVICHRFTQRLDYTGFMADCRKEAIEKAKASGTTEGVVKGEVWFKADTKDTKDPRPGMIAIGIARAKESEIFAFQKANRSKDDRNASTVTK